MTDPRVHDPRTMIVGPGGSDDLPDIASAVGVVADRTFPPGVPDRPLGGEFLVLMRHIPAAGTPQEYAWVQSVDARETIERQPQDNEVVYWPSDLTNPPIKNLQRGQQPMPGMRTSQIGLADGGPVAAAQAQAARSRNRASRR